MTFFQACIALSYILIGLLSFVIMAGAEWSTYKKIRFLKPFLWFAAIPVAVYACVMAWLDSTYFDAHGILSTIAWFPLLIFFGLFIFSVCIEIPLKTYTAQSQPVRVVTDGTYSLCRHPAFLWFIGWLVSAVFASKSITLAIATPFWIVAYIGFIFWEDMLTSISDFGEEYKKYQQTTPMVIPTKRSLIRFLRNVKSRINPTKLP